MRVFHSVVICEKPPSNRPRIGSRSVSSSGRMSVLLEEARDIPDAMTVDLGRDLGLSRDTLVQQAP